MCGKEQERSRLIEVIEDSAGYSIRIFKSDDETRVMSVRANDARFGPELCNAQTSDPNCIWFYF